METKETKEIKEKIESKIAKETQTPKKATNNIKNIIISLVILILIGVVGKITGLIEDFTTAFSAIDMSLRTCLTLVIEIASVILIANIILIVTKSLSQKKGRVGTLANVSNSLVKYAAVLIGFCWSLSILGVNISTIFASLGVVALILGFGAESLIADVVTGIFVLFENQYNKGDIIEVDGFRGTVESVGIRNISIVDAGGNVKIINNSDLRNIINRSNQRSVAITLIDVSYGTDLEKLEEKLPTMLDAIKEKQNALPAEERVFVGDITYAGVEELAASGVTLKFIADVDEKDVFKGRRLLNREIKVAFDKAGVQIPFPQIDVHNC